jgi:DHA1 family bicyclomycin/chloramphenicol resistance-like MFS transporter
MTGAQRSGPGFKEIVALAVTVMALNALAIDMMLPALGAIATDLGAPNENDRQLIIVVYIVANGVGQLFFGPIADRFGRRPVMLGALAAYCACSLLCILAPRFDLFLVGRALQGLATAASRVAVTAMIRDHFAGRRMAEVMSLALTMFMIAPIIAPGIGQLVLFAFPWRGIFVVLLLYGAAILTFVHLRARESLAVEMRRPIRASAIASAYLEFLQSRVSICHSLASGVCFGALFGFISASEQIFLGIYDLGARFPFAFAAVALAIACSNFVNSRLVGKIGMRRMLHGGLIAMLLINGAHAAVALSGGETFLLFMAAMMASFFCLGFVGPNAGAIAMEPMGHIAGAAAAANGFLGSTFAGLVGGLIASRFEGTTAPIAVGFFAASLVALALVLFAERGRLFQVGGARPA